MKIAVLGAGSWGSAMAKHLSERQHQVKLYVRKASQCRRLRETRENPNYLPGVTLPVEIEFVDSLSSALEDVQVVIGAIPAQSMKSFYEENPGILQGLPFISLSKGITNSSYETMEQLYRHYYPEGIYAALSGPSHAEEVAIGVPTALVLATKEEVFAQKIQQEFSSETLRIYRSDDVLGVELAAAFKNVIALAVGMATGLGFGDNTKAAIMTRGMAEILRLALAMGARQETFLGLSGFGDLIVTCTSRHSRNRGAGELLAQGYSEEETTKKIGMVVEGLTTLRSVIALAEKYNQSMPIAETLMKILEENLPVEEALVRLMMREYKEEL